MASTAKENVLALDLGAKCGWCFAEDGKILASGTQEFKMDRYSGGGIRFLKFRKWLDRMLERDINLIVYEEVRNHTGASDAHAYGGYMGNLTSWCEKHEIPYDAVPVGTIKKHVTGKGNASKQMVIDAVKTRGHNPVDDNEADAIALLYTYLEE